MLQLDSFRAARWMRTAVATFCAREQLLRLASHRTAVFLQSRMRGFLARRNARWLVWEADIAAARELRAHFEAMKLRLAFADWQNEEGMRFTRQTYANLVSLNRLMSGTRYKVIMPTAHGVGQRPQGSAAGKAGVAAPSRPRSTTAPSAQRRRGQSADRHLVARPRTAAPGCSTALGALAAAATGGGEGAWASVYGSCLEQGWDSERMLGVGSPVLSTRILQSWDDMQTAASPRARAISLPPTPATFGAFEDRLLLAAALPEWRLDRTGGCERSSASASPQRSRSHVPVLPEATLGSPRCAHIFGSTPSPLRQSTPRQAPAHYSWKLGDGPRATIGKAERNTTEFIVRS